MRDTDVDVLILLNETIVNIYKKGKVKNERQDKTKTKHKNNYVKVNSQKDKETNRETNRETNKQRIDQWSCSIVWSI